MANQERQLDDFRNRSYPIDLAPELPSEIRSMMKPLERNILFSIAKHYFRGEGCIVDAGLFLGASTFCFDRGLSENETLADDRGQAPKWIQSFERAVVNVAMLQDPALAQVIGKQGSDYSDYLRQILVPYSKYLDLHIGDIIKMEWIPRPIEVLFLDILKTKPIFDRCTAMFFGNLIPGRSLVIQQDYYWQFDWWINAYMERYCDFFTVIDSAETSCVFLNTTQLPEEAYKANSLDDLSSEGMIALLDSARKRSTTIFEYVMSELCTVEYIRQVGLTAEAEERMSAFEHIWSPVLRELSNQAALRRAANAATIVRRRLEKDKSNPA